MALSEEQIYTISVVVPLWVALEILSVVIYVYKDKFPNLSKFRLLLVTIYQVATTVVPAILGVKVPVLPIPIEESPPQLPANQQQKEAKS